MRQLIVVKQAELDLAGIGKFIAKDNPLNSSRFIQRLRKNFMLLTSQPFIGRPRDEFFPNLRSIAFGRYVIFYRVFDDKVEITRVIRSARDLKRVLTGS